jgi:uncharacterized membrane protein YkgB
MQTDIPAAVLGMATMMAFVGAILVTVIYFRMDGPWQPRLGFLGSILNGIFAALTVLYLGAGFTLPESSMIYDQLVAQRTMHAIGLVVTMSGAALLWTISIRWRGPEKVRRPISKQITHG